MLSSVPWKLYGPDWLEVWDGSRWLELSPSRAVIERGTSDPDGDFVEKVLLRAKYDNNNEDMRESQIKLVPAYDNTADVADISAIQLGRHHVLPNRMIALATELACDWKCGLDVSYIACYLSDHQLNWDAEASQMDWERSETSYVVGWTDLKENSMYYLYTIGYDNAGESYQHYVSFNMTASSQNQAIAYIQNVNYNGTKWTWDTKMNSYCKAYMMWASYDEEYFNLTDGIIAWFMDNESRKDNKTEEISYNSIDNNFWWELNGHLQIVTQGVGHDGNKAAGVIDRYRSIDYFQAPIRRAHFYSVPIDKDIFKNSFIRIK